MEVKHINFTPVGKLCIMDTGDGIMMDQIIGNVVIGATVNSSGGVYSVGVPGDTSCNT